MDSIIFALDADSVSRSEPQAIVISPSKDQWNDFGYRIRVDIFLPDRSTPDRRLELPGFLGFVGKGKEASDVRMLIERLNESADGRLTSDQLPTFFTMLPEIGAYREIVSRFGPKDATQLLVGMHDVVAAEETYPGPIWFRGVREAGVFKQAFMRSSEAFFARTNAGAILQGLEYEEVGLISEIFNIRFHMAGRPNEHNLSFKFDVTGDILPRRFAVVIGKNGVGKSQTLGHIANAALRGDKEMTDGKGGRPSLNRLLAFAPTLTTSSVFPSDRRRNPRVWYRRFALAHPGGSRERHTTAELIMRLARSKEQIQTRDRLQLFLQAITAIDDWRELGLRTGREHREIVRFEELQSGGEQTRLERLAAIDLGSEPVRVIQGRAYPLSSGEQSFLRFAAIASLHIENSTLVLLDEPEIHLHPNFISQFVAVLDNLLEQTGSAAIIATHSVYFVREAFEDQVVVLRSDHDRTIVAEKPTLKTFGADVGSISYFVFGEDQPSRLACQVERRIAESSSSWSETFESYKDDLSLELLGEIRARIEPPKPVRKA
ncbi:AAA family ATPase [Agrobacterium pusense]|uniref:AAA family ATPase n=1 Tax=Agrobacterium pusense TaxID=648995 RepID=UPI00244851D6|nr:AAA family ATPase [Agrobacterium pusense]MDH0869808.1 ATP-binding protein [Agrobacterium pusense]